MSKAQRYLVLVTVFLGLVFDGVELGLMPVASLSVSKSLLGAGFTPELGGEWFARFTAALMLGAAIGGIVLGSLGDRVGRTRAMGVCILFYTIFAAMGAYAQTQEQMLVLRFLVGLGVGGLWPNGIALVSECWSSASRPLVSGAMMAGLNVGVLALSQVARQWHITPESWRWVFQFAGVPALLGVFVLVVLPESPKWLASRGMSKASVTPLRELFQPNLIRFTLVGILLSAIPMIGAWSASKWMIPWSDKIAGAAHADYKAATQGWWALGATLGSLLGGQCANWLGRRLSYCLISLATVSITCAMFQMTAPLEASFHPIVCAQGFVATLFFGWLALYLPELFPTRVRATGSGLAYNSGRFGTAVGVLAAGFLFSALGGDYARVGAICASVYALGVIVIWWAPDTKALELAD
ncbi:MFS transporter [Prosthecobacter fluviatilis]|uniref:MFS transporter n=1 Tax=Prosthecobacter fluviatilis TaxID=445931 RepID=A0ABW0KRX0_9BACT